jgi:hypothetical protein
MMRLYGVLALLGVVGLAYFFGGQHREAAIRLEMAQAEAVAREAFSKLEAVRVAAEDARARQLQSQEDEARAQPVTHAECLPADRVRRLDALR